MRRTTTRLESKLLKNNFDDIYVLSFLLPIYIQTKKTIEKDVELAQRADPLPVQKISMHSNSKSMLFQHRPSSHQRTLQSQGQLVQQT